MDQIVFVFDLEQLLPLEEIVGLDESLMEAKLNSVKQGVLRIASYCSYAGNISESRRDLPSLGYRFYSSTEYFSLPPQLTGDWHEFSLSSWEAIEDNLAGKFSSILAAVQTAKPGDKMVGHKSQASTLCKVLEEVSALYSWDRPALHCPVKKGSRAVQKLGNSVVVMTRLPEDMKELDMFLGGGARKEKPTARDVVDAFTSKRINTQFKGELNIALHILDTEEVMVGEKVEVFQLFNRALKTMRGGVLSLSSLITLFGTKADTNSQCSTLMCSSKSMQGMPSSAAIQAYLTEVTVSNKTQDENYVQGEVKVCDCVLGVEFVKCGVELIDLESRGFIRSSLFKPGQKWKESFSVWSDKSLAFSAVLAYLQHSGQCLVMENKDNLIVVMFYHTETSALFCIMDKVESHFYHMLLSMDSHIPTITLTGEINSLLTDITTLQFSPSKETNSKTNSVPAQFDTSILENWRLPDTPTPQIVNVCKAASAYSTSQNSSYHKFMQGVRENYISVENLSVKSSNLNKRDITEDQKETAEGLEQLSDINIMKNLVRDGGDDESLEDNSTINKAADETVSEANVRDETPIDSSEKLREVPASNEEHEELGNGVTVDIASNLAEVMITDVPEERIRHDGGLIGNNDLRDDPFIFNEEDREIVKYNPLKRKLASLCDNKKLESKENKKKLRKICEEVKQPRVETFTVDKKFTLEQNSKLQSIFSDVLYNVDNNENITERNTKSSMKESEISQICLAQCNVCNFTSWNFCDLFNKSLHHCICDHESLKCETCGENISSSDSLSLHAVKHQQCVMFLSPSNPFLKLEQELCSANCPKQMCFNTDKSKIVEIQAELSEMKKSELHNFLLTRLQSQKELGLDSVNTFVFKSEVFCHNSATALLGLSEYMVNQVHKEHLAGKVKFTHGNLGNFYLSSKRNKAVAFILNFVRTHCENLPDREVMRLPSYLNVKDIYKNYLENVPKMLHMTERSFCHVFKTHFKDVARDPVGLPRVIFMAKHSHPICSECAQVNTLCQVAKNESDILYANERKRKHLLEMREKFIQFRDRREQAVRYPDDFLHLNLDDIDQSKMKTPYAVQKTKECSGMLRLDNHCTGVIVTNGKFANDRCLFAYLNNNQFCQDSNKTISIVFDVLQSVKEKLGVLPKKLFVQSDNCSRDLKNQLVLSFYWCLVEVGVFEEVVVSHLDVGHTHGKVDQMFSVISSHLRKLELPTFETLLSELTKVSIDSQKIIVKQMDYTTDFVDHISEYLQPMSGHKSFFAFKIRRENEKTKMFVKQDVLDKTWQFEEGIWLLRSPPSLMNLGVSLFRTESDFGEIFSSVWSKYIPTKYSEEEVSKIKTDWEARISYLVNLDESQFKGFGIFKLVSDEQREHGLSKTFRNRIDRDTKKKEASLTATFYQPEIKPFSSSNLVTDCSLVFYTHVKTTRPWIGLFVETVEDGGSDTGLIKVEWLRKEKKEFVLESPAQFSVLDVDSIMFCDVLRNLSDSGHRGGPYSLDVDSRKQIMTAYKERDSALS